MYVARGICSRTSASMAGGLRPGAPRENPHGQAGRNVSEDCTYPMAKSEAKYGEMASRDAMSPEKVESCQIMSNPSAPSG